MGMLKTCMECIEGLSGAAARTGEEKIIKK